MTKEHKKNNSTYNIAMCGVLTALAMIFSYIESIIPVPIPVPGIKLGVANIAVITILYTLGIKEAVIINILRLQCFLVILTAFCLVLREQCLVW